MYSFHFETVCHGPKLSGTKLLTIASKIPRAFTFAQETLDNSKYINDIPTPLFRGNYTRRRQPRLSFPGAEELIWLHEFEFVHIDLKKKSICSSINQIINTMLLLSLSAKLRKLSRIKQNIYSQVLFMASDWCNISGESLLNATSLPRSHGTVTRDNKHFVSSIM